MNMRSLRRLLCVTGVTLVELLAIVVIIAIVAGLSFGTYSYITKKTDLSRAKSQLAVLELAIECYKSDYGFYPLSSDVRLSSSGLAEVTNSARLYVALTQGTRKYIRPRTKDLLTASGLTYFIDPWSMPYIYYRPATNLSLTIYEATNTYVQIAFLPYYGRVYYNNYAVGGQMNQTTFDLFSSGPDKATYVTSGASYWTSSSSANDDIASWKR